MNLRKGVKLSTKTAGATLFTAVFISVIISVFSIVQMSNSLLESSREHTAALAQIAAISVDGSAFAQICEGGEETQEYQAVFDSLACFLEDHKVAYIYSMRMADGELQFVVDTDTEEGAAIGEPYESYDKIEEAFQGRVTVDDEVTTDEWGSFYSAFAPIYDGESIVGIVGVDCSINDINAQIGEMRGKLILIGIMSIIPGLLLSFLVGYFMTKNVRSINVKMDGLASNEGDLTQELQIKSKDEIGQMAGSFNRFIGKLKAMILAVKDKETRLSEVTISTNRQVADSVSELNGITDSLKEISRTMSDTNDAIVKILEAVGSAKELSASVYGTAREQAEYAMKIRQQADAMQENSNATKNRVAAQTRQIAKELDEKVKEAAEVERIARLTEEIISISSQTSLLSLNASIEAARAGESGRGFAVVADEIGKLAEATAQTASQIVEINQFIVKAVNDLADTASSMVSFMQNEVQQDYDEFMEVGTAYSKDAAEFMRQMERFSDLSQRLRDDMGMVEDNVSHIAGVIDERTESVLSATRNAETIYEKMHALKADSQMNSQIAGELNEVLSKFKV